MIIFQNFLDKARLFEKVYYFPCYTLDNRFRTSGGGDNSWYRWDNYLRLGYGPVRTRWEFWMERFRNDQAIYGRITLARFGRYFHYTIP
jgi:hypothetical protein